MQVKIKNAHIGQVMDLLFNLSLKGKESRQRTKLIKCLDEQIKELGEQERALIKEHCNLSVDGSPLKKNNDTEWDIKDIELFVADKKELLEEELVLDGASKSEMLSTVKNVLLDCQKEFSGPEALIYDYLCDQFEMEVENK